MSKHLYFLGIGGTLMGSLAQLAKQMGFGQRQRRRHLSTYVRSSFQAGITAFEGFDPSQLDPAPDEIIIGNAGLPRGNEAVRIHLRAQPKLHLGGRMVRPRST